MNFNSHTDVVVRVAVDLVNLLTPGEERGRRYTPPEADKRTAAVGAVLNGAGGRAATWEEAASLCFVAAELRGVFEAVSTGAVDEAARHNFQLKSARVEGHPAGGWVLADFGMVIVHIFSPDQRRRYKLEELWHDSKVMLRIQ